MKIFSLFKSAEREVVSAITVEFDNLVARLEASAEAAKAEIMPLEPKLQFLKDDAAKAEAVAAKIKALVS